MSSAAGKKNCAPCAEDFKAFFQGFPRLVLHVDLGMEFRGGQRQLLLLAEKQHHAGQRVCVVAPEGAPVLRKARLLRLPVWQLPARRDYRFRNIVWGWKTLPPGVLVHTHDARSASLGALWRVLRRDIFLVHTRRVSYAPGRGVRAWKYRVADAVVCVSADVQKIMRAAGVERTAVIHSALDKGRYVPRTTWHGGRVGIIGALTAQKGHTVLFEALKNIANPPEVWVIGDGPLEVFLREKVRMLGIPRVVFWGNMDSAQILPALDVLVVPSVDGEGSCAVIKEGWAARVPVLCSDLAANCELVTEEQTGLTFPVGDARALAETLELLLADADLVAKLVSEGTRALEKYTPQAQYQAYCHVYQGLLRG